MHISPVNKKTFFIFISLLKELMKFEQAPPLKKSDEKRLKQHIFDDHHFEAFLVQENSQFIGYFITYFTYSSYTAKPILYIEDIFIQKAYRNKGYGKKILSFCSDYAREKGCDRIDWTALKKNTQAHAFYKKIGAQKLDKVYFRLELVD